MEAAAAAADGNGRGKEVGGGGAERGRQQRRLDDRIVDEVAEGLGLVGGDGSEREVRRGAAGRHCVDQPSHLGLVGLLRRRHRLEPRALRRRRRRLRRRRRASGEAFGQRFRRRRRVANEDIRGMSTVAFLKERERERAHSLDVGRPRRRRRVELRSRREERCVAAAAAAARRAAVGAPDAAIETGEPPVAAADAAAAVVVVVGGGSLGRKQHDVTPREGAVGEAGGVQLGDAADDGAGERPHLRRQLGRPALPLSILE